MFTRPHMHTHTHTHSTHSHTPTHTRTRAHSTLQGRLSDVPSPGDSLPLPCHSTQHRLQHSRWQGELATLYCVLQLGVSLADMVQALGRPVSMRMG